MGFIRLKNIVYDLDFPLMVLHMNTYADKL